MRFENVVDLTAEFSEPPAIRSSPSYRSFPILDGSSTNAGCAACRRCKSSTGSDIHSLRAGSWTNGTFCACCATDFRCRPERRGWLADAMGGASGYSLEQGATQMHSDLCTRSGLTTAFSGCEPAVLGQSVSECAWRLARAADASRSVWLPDDTAPNTISSSPGGSWTLRNVPEGHPPQ